MTSWITSHAKGEIKTGEGFQQQKKEKKKKQVEAENRHANLYNIIL